MALLVVFLPAALVFRFRFCCSDVTGNDCSGDSPLSFAHLAFCASVLLQLFDGRRHSSSVWARRARGREAFHCLLSISAVVSVCACELGTSLESVCVAGPFYSLGGEP